MPDKLVKLYPTGLAYIMGVPAIEQEVSEAEAKRLLKYQPPAFTTDPPGKPAKPTEARQTGGLPDSKE